MRYGRRWVIAVLRGWVGGLIVSNDSGCLLLCIILLDIGYILEGVFLINQRLFN